VVTDTIVSDWVVEVEVQLPKHVSCAQPISGRAITSSPAMAARRLIANTSPDRAEECILPSQLSGTARFVGG
jgi:hypothetical protein